MAYEENVRSQTFIAGSDLSDDQYKFAALASDGQVDVAGNGVDSVGVIYINGVDAAGKAITLATGGVAKVLAGGVIDEGDRVTIDTTGRAVATIGEDEYVVGVAKTPAAAAGEVFSLMLIIPGTVDLNQA